MGLVARGQVDRIEVRKGGEGDRIQKVEGTGGSGSPLAASGNGGRGGGGE